MTTPAPDTHAIVQRLARAALRTRALWLARGTISTIGSVTLLPHQRAAADWLFTRLTRTGGALLADPPGLGKTFTALAVAARLGNHALVIAPAALRDHWRTCATAADVPIDFISLEQLSAPTTPRRTTTRHAAPARLVIIDEAHHLRTPSTRRHQRTARLCLNAHVLLLSATPIHNGQHDLAHITQLFHRPAERTSARQLIRRLTLRRTLDDIRAATLAGGAAAHMPTTRLRTPITFAPRHAELTAAIAALPALPTLPAPPGATHADSHPLVQLGMLHALRSSAAAARQRIHHRIAITLAIEHAALAGVNATPHLQRAFAPLEHDVQLAMPALLSAPAARHAPNPALARGAREQRGALERMLPLVDDRADARRAVVLRRLARWCNGPVVAFTWSAATAHALHRHLRTQPGIALLTGTTARIASGSIGRAEALGRLLPRTDGSFAAAHDRVRLLITTDVLSEGLSLSGVTTIVHLDLPWTIARIDQRTGRAVRIGAPVREVQVMHLPAPLPPAALDALHALLARKQRAMRVVTDAHEASDGEVVALLVQLAGNGTHGGNTRQARARWETLQHEQLRRRRAIALVQLQGRRQLVVLDGVRLRRPVPADWQLLAAATRARPAPRLRQLLLQALRQHQADRECSARVAMAGDVRQRARVEADVQLWRVGRHTRAVEAERVSGWRRGMAGVSRPGELEQLTLTLQDAAPAAVGDRVRIVCGVGLVPARDG